MDRAVDEDPVETGEWRDALGSVLGIGAAGAVFAALHDPGGSDAEVFRLIWAGLGVVGVLSAAVALRARQP